MCERPAMTKFLFKANDDVLSYCSCAGQPAMSTGQLDCPWCGCGWMISCSSCKKSFVFAEIAETDVSMQELGRREALARGLTDIDDNDVRDWAEAMTEALAPFAVGQIVVYLDGEYLPVDATDVAFTGYYAEHDFTRLPHFEALADPGRLRAVLGERGYWIDRERPDRE
jgi:hypothetical protein